LEKLVQLFIASKPDGESAEAEDIVAYKKQVSGLLGRIHKQHVKIDEGIYEELRKMGEEAKREN